MKNPDRDLLVLLKHDFINQKAIEQEVQCLTEILRQAESLLKFCKVHELVDRNFITSAENRIIKAIHQVNLKPFRFLLNKN